MSPDRPSSEAVPGTVDVLSYVSLAQACRHADPGDRLRTLLRPVVHRCLDRWSVIHLLDVAAPATDPPSEGILARVSSGVRRVAEPFTASPQTWAAHAGVAVDAFLEQQILWVTLDWVVAPVLRRCLDQWDLRCLHEHQTAATDGVPWFDELLVRIRQDLRGSEKFVGSRTTWTDQAAARMDSFLEQRILLVTTRYCSLPRRRAIVGPEPFAGLMGRLSELDDHACVSPDEREELRLVADAQGGDDNALGRLWERTLTSIRGAVRGHYGFSDHVVDDLAGQTAVSLVQSIATFDSSRSTFRAFARRVATRRVVDHLRAQKRAARAAEPKGDVAAGKPDAGAEAPPASENPDAPESGASSTFSGLRWPDDRDVPDRQSHNPDDDDVLTLQKFFHHAFGDGGRLHCKLALGFNVLHEYPGSKIVTELSDQPFSGLTRRLVSDYPRGGLLRAWIASTTSPLEADLHREPALQDRTFEAYYTGRTADEKRKNVEHWVNDLRRQTLTRMARAR